MTHASRLHARPHTIAGTFSKIDGSGIDSRMTQNTASSAKGKN